ncbi:MAG: hypothetical protein QXN16_02985 [Candidatus Micrarchaeaceae archaeon]
MKDKENWKLLLSDFLFIPLLFSLIGFGIGAYIYAKIGINLALITVIMLVIILIFCLDGSDCFMPGWNGDLYNVALAIVLSSGFLSGILISFFGW